jgi:hypothetical protein
MPKVCQDSCEGTGIMPKASPNFCEGTGIVPKGSQDSCEGTGITLEIYLNLKHLTQFFSNISSK